MRRPIDRPTDRPRPESVSRTQETLMNTLAHSPADDLLCDVEQARAELIAARLTQQAEDAPSARRRLAGAIPDRRPPAAVGTVAMTVKPLASMTETVLSSTKRDPSPERGGVPYLLVGDTLFHARPTRRDDLNIPR
jgi:hypothetical protein